jgi:integrase
VPSTQARPRWGEYLDQWLNEIQVEPTTLQRYKGLVDHQIKPHIGSAILQEPSTAAVKSWHKPLRERGGFKGKPLADNSVLQAHRVLGKALRNAKESKLVSTNVASDISQPKVKKKIRILTGTRPKERIEWLAKEEDELHAIVALALATGMRRGELSYWPSTGPTLTWTAVRSPWSAALEELKDGTLRFKAPKTKAGLRTIPFQR